MVNQDLQNGCQIRIFGKAKNSSLKDFMRWMSDGYLIIPKNNNEQDLTDALNGMIEYFDKNVKYSPEHQDVYLKAKEAVEKVNIKRWDNTMGGWPEPNGIVG